MDAKIQIQSLLKKAGIDINGKKDYDPKVLNENLYLRVWAGGSLALGEAYVDGWWEVKNLDEFFYKILSAKITDKFNLSWPMVWLSLKSYFFNLQTKSRSAIVGERHYDIGNDLYKAMLGKTMAYSCAYWKNAKTLDKAQEAKFDLICKKIGLKKGEKILDIGCGWGGFLKFAAQKYGAKGVGITVSKEQLGIARNVCKGLPVEIKLQDYRSLEGKFDHIASIGMFEHVGPKNYRIFMQTVNRLLKDDGFFLLHTIGTNQPWPNDPWVEKYIFPNGILPSPSQITKAAEGMFLVEDWHNFGAYYDKTLLAWFKNFDKNWPKLKSRYSERFYRMWKFYLLSFAGNFRSRHIRLWQIVFTKKGVAGIYKTAR